MIKGIIFDLDGTMIDNMMVHHRAWQEVLSIYGLDLSLDEVMAKIHGVNEEILKRLFSDRFTDEECQAISKQKEAIYRRVFQDELKLINGLDAFLDQIDSFPLPKAIATAAPQENVSFVMDGLELWERFETVIHAGHVRNGKPDPEVFIKASSALGLHSSDCLIFEDSPTGVETALRANAPTIVITTTHKQEEFANYTNVKGFIKDYNQLDLTRLLEQVDS
jgi:HAD superfamily hydrolase (TIGR01509 family)